MCGHEAERQKTIRHIGNIWNNLKETSKTGRNVGFKDILTSENPGNNSNLNVVKVLLTTLNLIILRCCFVESPK